jgi:hypothetical protein
MSDELAVSPPPGIAGVHAALIHNSRISSVEPLESLADGAWGFMFSVRVELPNEENLPSEITLRAKLPSAYPFAPVEVFSESPELRGFHHQDAETHKLCLKEEALAPNNQARLATYVNWAIEWVNDAASGKLLPTGHPYELPDFSRKLLKEKPPVHKKLWFAESSDSYPIWKDHLGHSGKVELIDLAKDPAILASSFSFGKDVVWKFPGSATFDITGTKVEGRWLILPSLAYFRNRPPHHFGELRQMCEASAIDLDALLQDLWASDSCRNVFSVLLVGAGIPGVAGDLASEIHWQPLAVRNVNGEPDSKASRKGPVKRRQAWRKLGVLKRFGDNVEIPWTTCENISEARLHKRGALDAVFTKQKIVLVGCGAIGSCIADQLIRSGVEDLTLIDKEDFEPGNHSRHVLTGRSFYTGKAMALRNQLQCGSPHAKLRSFAVTVPDFRGAAGIEALSALNECNVVIDCSASESAFRWLSKFSANSTKKFVHMFISFDAGLLVLAFSGKDVPARLALKSFEQQSKSNSLPNLSQIDFDAYWRDTSKEELVIPGAGCWHPTFPARWNHIQCLMSAAVDMLERRISMPQSSSGFVAIAKRHPLNKTAHGPTPVVEWVYQSLHR